MKKERIQIYDASNIDALPWPKTEAGEYARKFLTPLIKDGVSHYMENVQTELKALLLDDLVLPITINSDQYQNSFVCSPYNYYITYALESLDNFKYWWIRPPIKVLLRALGKLFRFGEINKVVMVNNWLLSTNLHPKLSQEQVNLIRVWLEEKYPQHAIMFRSVNTYEGSELYNHLSHAGFSLIAAREVFFLDAREGSVFNSRIFKSDLKLLKESNYEVVSHENIPLEAADRLAELYGRVYLNKHSTLNPRLNAHFMRLVLRDKLFHVNALVKEGSIDGVTGYFYQGHTMTSPLLGYDTTHSRDDKLYRLTATVLSLEARRQGKLFHLSSGASFFKKIRKGQGNMENIAVYHTHLPIRRRLSWWVLKGVSVGMTPCIRSYQG